MELINRFKKGELYSPDSLSNLPKECNQYFTQEGLEEWGHKDYEYGTQRCIKSFVITINIKILT